MKTLPTLAAAALAALLAAPASAMVSLDALNANVQEAVDGAGQVSVSVRGDTAYLSGWTQGSGERHAAARAALDTAGVEKVVNGVLD